MRSRILTGVAAALCAGLFSSAPTHAAEVVAVRVGNHPTYTRVVFQLDAAAGYGVENAAGTEPRELLVRMDAGSAPRMLEPRTVMVDRIAVEGLGDRSTARIVLRKAPSRVKERILANPPRLVFDLVFPEPMLQAAERRAAKLVAAKAPSVLPVPESTAPAEAPVAAPVVPEPAAPANALAPAELPIAAPEGVVAALVAPAVSVAEVVPPAMPEPLLEAQSLLERLAAADIDHPFYGSILGGGLVLALFMVLWLRKRTRRAPVEESASEAPIDPGTTQEVVLTAVAAESVPDTGAEAQFDTTQEVAPPAVAAEAVSETGAEAQPFPLPDGDRDAFVTTPIVALDEPYLVAGPGQVDDEDPEKEEETMDIEGQGLHGETLDVQGHDLHGGASSFSGVPVAPTEQAAAGGARDAEIGRRLGAFERRMEQLEARLDEALDARERLERQVAAQAEELRVQRSSIARTQRAVRSIGREGAEDATEPALRPPRG